MVLWPYLKYSNIFKIVNIPILVWLKFSIKFDILIEMYIHWNTNRIPLAPVSFNTSNNFWKKKTAFLHLFSFIFFKAKLFYQMTYIVSFTCCVNATICTVFLQVIFHTLQSTHTPLSKIKVENRGVEYKNANGAQDEQCTER